MPRLQQILAFIDRSRYPMWAGYIGVGMVIGLLEAIAGILFLGMLATFNGAGASVGRLVAAVGAMTGGADPVAGMALLVVIVYLIKNVAMLAQVYLRSYCVDGAFVGLSHTLLRSYLAAPYEFHLRRHSAELIKNINMAIELIARGVLLGIAAIIGEMFVIFGLFLVAVNVAPVLTLLVLAIMGLYIAAISRATRGRAQALGAEQQDLAKESQRLLSRMFDVLKEIKIHSQAEAFADAYARLRGRQAVLLRRYEMLSIVPGVAAELLVVALVAGAAIGVSLAGQRDPAALAIVGLFAYLALRLKPSATRVATGLNSIRFGMRAVDIISADLKLAPRERDQAAAPIRIADTVELRNISYRYPDAERTALDRVSLTIRRGETIGIVGSSGSGKSTFAEILLGLLQPTSGEILVDGKTIVGTSDAWHAGLGYVPQQVALLDDTIRRNIAFGVPDAEIDEMHLAHVVRMAQLDDVVSQLPLGLETMLGENGLGLSGGQRQRVAIARALYRQPQILVFDEATSGLDQETERELTRAVEKLYGSITIVIVAHRLSTLSKCDRVVRLRAGAVVEIGPLAQVEPVEAVAQAGLQ